MGCVTFSVKMMTWIRRQHGRNVYIDNRSYFVCMDCDWSIMEALKDELKGMMKEREAMEKEIEERTSRLQAPDGPGLSGNLVDKEVRHWGV